MFKRIVSCLFLIVATANIAEAIDGDLDLDGDVDFQDFLILVQNFGKEGPPASARTDTIYVTQTDTIFAPSDTIYVTQTDTVFAPSDTIYVTQTDTVFTTIRDTIYVTKVDTFYIEVGAPVIPYDRSLYKHWVDADGDCQDTRQEVLISESLRPVVLDDRGCRVVSGEWKDLYTGQTFTDPSRLDIDHFIPLGEAHRSGADTWTPEQRQAFANDLMHEHSLIAVSASANRSKGDRDPANWLPPDESFHCEYIKRWVAVKAYFNLRMDATERNFLQNHPCLQND